MGIVTDTPRVWIADLAAYNEGYLHGKWVDATDEDELEQAKDAIIASSPAHFPEEWAIHDYDGFPDAIVRQLGEYSSFKTVANVGRALEEHGEAFGKWLGVQDYGFDLDADDLGEQFQEHYRGEWESEKAYAMNLLIDDGLGWSGLDGEQIDQIASYLDWDSIATELFQHGNYTFVDGHVFEDEV
jgi:prepilin-type processing-associated H-X9-DG protein